MALIGNLSKESVYNIYCEDLKNVYFQIVGVLIDTEKEMVRVKVRGFASEYARHNQGKGVFKRVFYIPFNEFKNIKCAISTLTKKSYDYIKKLPEFENCKDSLKKYTGKIEITKEKVEKQEKELHDLIGDLMGENKHN